MQKSPLFRLPAELREEIWTLAYGNITININDPNRPFPRGRATQPRDLSYSICGPDNGMNCKHIEPRVGHIIAPWHQEFHYKYKDSTWSSCPCARPFTHPLVNKQFWSETTHILLATSTWVFHQQHDLRQLLCSSQTWIPRIRQLVIRAANVFSIVGFCNEWQGTLTWRLLRVLESLEGVRFDIYVCYSSDHDPSKFSLDTDLLRNKTWVKAGLPGIIRGFQQHKLKYEQTAVKLDCGELSGSLSYKYADMEAWCDAFLELLLTHVPLGQGTSVSEKRSTVEAAKRERMRVGNVSTLQNQDT